MYKQKNEWDEKIWENFSLLLTKLASISYVIKLLKFPAYMLLCVLNYMDILTHMTYDLFLKIKVDLSLLAAAAVASLTLLTTLVQCTCLLCQFSADSMKKKILTLLIHSVRIRNSNYKRGICVKASKSQLISYSNIHGINISMYDMYALIMLKSIQNKCETASFHQQLETWNEGIIQCLLLTTHLKFINTVNLMRMPLTSSLQAHFERLRHMSKD